MKKEILDKETVDKIIANCFEVEEYPLNDKEMYDGFEIPCGRNFRPEWVPPEKTWWWPEDLVLDLLKKEKVFGDRPVILTRNLKGKNDFPLGCVFKGPLSTIDLWIPNYGFAEIKYAGNSGRDYWGFDLDHRSIKNICSIQSLEFNMTHDVWKNNKIFLIVVHKPEPGDKVSISIIDLSEKFDFVSPYSEEKTTKPRFHPNINQVAVNVKAENCLKRFDEVPFRKYRERCHEKIQ